MKTRNVFLGIFLLVAAFATDIEFTVAAAEPGYTMPAALSAADITGASV